MHQMGSCVLLVVSELLRKMGPAFAVLTSLILLSLNTTLASNENITRAINVRSNEYRCRGSIKFYTMDPHTSW